MRASERATFGIRSSMAAGVHVHADEPWTGETREGRGFDQRAGLQLQERFERRDQ